MAEFAVRRVSGMPEVDAPAAEDLVPVSVKQPDGSYLSGHIKYVDFAGGLNLQTFVEVPAGAVNGSNAVFTLSHNPVTTSVQVYKNGLLLLISPTGDLTLSGVTLTFNVNEIPLPGDVIQAIYQAV